VIATLWMGIYPESFIAPMRADIAHLDARLAAAPASDAQVTPGHPVAGDEHHENAEHAAKGVKMNFSTSLRLVAGEELLSVSGWCCLLVCAWAGDKSARW
jgi:hypothetical protein